MRPLSLVLAGGLFLAAAALSAQPTSGRGAQPEAGQLANQRIYLRAASDSEEAASLRLFLGQAIIADSQAILVLDAAEADAIISIDARADGSLFLVNANGRPASRSGGQADFNQTARVSSLTPLALNAFIRAVVQAIDRAYPPLPPEVVEVETTEVITELVMERVVWSNQLVFHGPPGTTIAIFGRQDLEIDQSGQAGIELEEQISVHYRASLAGHRPIEDIIYMGREDLDIDLDFTALRRLELRLSLHYANLVPGLGLDWFYNPGRAYLGGSLESSLFALIPFTFTDEHPRLYYLELQAWAGWRLGLPHRRLLANIQLGLAGRLEFDYNILRLPDWAPVGLVGSASGQYRLNERVHLYLESGLRLSYIHRPYDDKQVVGGSPQPPLSLVHYPDGWTYFGLLFLHLPDFCLGLRIELW